MRKKLWVIIDTNLWISFLLTRKYKVIDDLLEKGEITLIFSQELISEFLKGVNRPKLKKFFTKTDLELLLNIIAESAEFIPVISTVHVCRDKKDNFLLALARDSTADYLITGDKDLLVIKQFDQTKIVNITEFIVK